MQDRHPSRPRTEVERGTGPENEKDDEKDEESEADPNNGDLTQKRRTNEVVTSFVN
jgi:hypothetical protein